MLVLHHLGVSQSERIVWLLEELGVEYKLVRHTRDPILSPDSLKNVPGNEMGRSPFFEDTDEGVAMAESSAIGEYLVTKYNPGKLNLTPDDKHYADYLYWFHFANATTQTGMVSGMLIAGTGLPDDNQMKQFSNQRLHVGLKHKNDWLKDHKWLAGDKFTAADCMSMYSVTTQRYWGPAVSLKEYDHLLRWMKDCSDRPGYQRAMEKGDPEMQPLLGPEPPEKGMMEMGGVTSDHWKKK